MSPVVLGSAIGSAAVVAGRGAATAVGQGLSFAAELLQAAGGGSETAAGAGGEVAADRKREDLNQRIAAIADRVRRLLAAAGIELSQPLELTGDGLGGIALAQPHAQQPAIEAALDSDIVLARDFDRLRRDYGDFVAEHATAALPSEMTVVISGGDRDAY